MLNVCPKCGSLLNGNETNCPNCKTELVNKNIETLDLNQPRNNTKKEVPKVLKILLIILLSLISILLVLNIIKMKKHEKSINQNEIIEENINNEEETNNFDLVDEYISNEKALFVFNKDGSFYYYDSLDNTDDNYYVGQYNYLQGIEALKDMNYSEEDFSNNFGQDIDVNNVYSIEIEMSKRISDGQEVEDKTKWWILLVMKDNKNVIAYNKTSDVKYELTRK